MWLVGLLAGSHPPSMLDKIHTEPPSALSQPESGWDSRCEILAKGALAELLRIRIPPTPRNYEIWYIHLSGTNPELSRRLNELGSRQGGVTEDMLETAFELHVGSAGSEMEEVGTTATEIEKTASDLLSRLAATQNPLKDYSASLIAFPQQIKEAASLASLAGSVATLAGETARVIETNRSLQEQVDRSTRRISSLRQTLASVRRAATTDALTGLLNRRAFEARTRRTLSQTGDEACTLLMADIDHFKRFNDLHGHNTGDLVLRLVARLLEQSVKGRDAVGRYGGEEFAILLAGADATGGEAVGRQICEAISTKSLVDKLSQRSIGRVTLSIGVARHRPGERLSALVERADSALYMAKRTGRNRVFVSPD